MFDEDLSVEIGDGDVVAVHNDEDLLESVLSADDVCDSRQGECAPAVQFAECDARGKVGGRRDGAEGPAGFFGEQGLRRFGAGSISFRSGTPSDFRCDAAGEPLMWAVRVVNLIERIDLSLQSRQGIGERLLVEVTE